MSVEKGSYAVTVSYGHLEVKRRLKAEKNANLKLVGVLGVGLKVNEKLRVVLPLTEVDAKEFAEVARRCGVAVEDVVAKVVEFEEEKKEERELRIGST